MFALRFELLTDCNLTLPRSISITALPFNTVLGSQRLILLQSVGLALPMPAKCTLQMRLMDCFIDRSIASFVILQFSGATSAVTRRASIEVKALSCRTNISTSPVVTPSLPNRSISLTINVDEACSSTQFAIFAGSETFSSAQCWSAPHFYTVGRRGPPCFRVLRFRPGTRESTGRFLRSQTTRRAHRHAPRTRQRTPEERRGWTVEMKGTRRRQPTASTTATAQCPR